MRAAPSPPLAYKFVGWRSGPPPLFKDLIRKDEFDSFSAISLYTSVAVEATIPHQKDKKGPSHVLIPVADNTVHRRF